jgi:hypothetical protein
MLICCDTDNHVLCLNMCTPNDECRVICMIVVWRNMSRYVSYVENIELGTAVIYVLW